MTTDDVTAAQAALDAAEEAAKVARVKLELATEAARVKSPLELARERVEAARADLATLEAEAEAIRHAEYLERITASFDAMMALPDEAFYAGDDARHDVRPYVLPFGSGSQKWNPAGNDEEHGFGETWTANSTAIICTRVDEDRSHPSRLIWTSGMVMPSKGDRVSGDLIGQRFLARHDQTGAKLGEYVIVGLSFYGPEGGSTPARTVGEVPSRKFGQSTYK